MPLESIQRDEEQQCYRLRFRLPTLAQTTNVEVVWRHHRLSEMTLSVLSRAEFLEKLLLQHPTLTVRVGEQAVACQTFVTSQCRGLFASALLNSATSLVPLVDLGLHVDWRREGDAQGKQFPVQLSSSQLKGKQALLTVCPGDRPKRAGCYVASWLLGDELLASQRIKAITQSHFLSSLRVSATRLVVQTTKGEVRLARQMPERGGVARIGPCFLVSSSEQGMAGLCSLCVRARQVGGLQAPTLLEQDLLVTDGPAPFVPGTLDLHEVEQITAFELHAGARVLGALPLTAAPEANFDSEGGFQPPPDYAWSSAAEDQLQEKLAKLLSAGQK